MELTHEQVSKINTLFDRKVHPNKISFACDVDISVVRSLYYDWLLKVTEKPANRKHHEMTLLYNALPNEFQRSTAVEVCRTLCISRNSFEIFMRKRDFASKFIRVKQGWYRKAETNSTE